MPAAKGSARTPHGPIIVPSPYTDMIKGQNFQGYISKFILNSVSIKFWQSIKIFADSVRTVAPFIMSAPIIQRVLLGKETN